MMGHQLGLMFNSTYYWIQLLIPGSFHWGFPLKGTPVGLLFSAYC